MTQHQEPPAADDTVLLHVPVSELAPNKHQPRTDFDEEELNELAESLKSEGFIAPIVVRSLGSQGGGPWEIIAGERRWRAARLAGIDVVPVLVRQDVEDEETARLALVENLQRVNLNPIDEASALQQIKLSGGYTDEDLALFVNKSRPYVTGLLSLLNLPPQVQGLVRTGALTSGHGRALTRVPDPTQCTALAESSISSRWSVRELEAAVGKVSRKKRSARKRHLHGDESDLVLEATDILEELLDTRVQISPGRERGKIVIEFSDQQDLARMLVLIRRLKTLNEGPQGHTG